MTTAVRLCLLLLAIVSLALPSQLVPYQLDSPHSLAKSISGQSPRALAARVGYQVGTALAAAPEAGVQPQVARVVLENGLTVVVQENHAVDIVTLQAWVRAGSKDEDDERNGVSHLIEHMLFKGTRKRKVGEIDREVEGLGGITNASTWFDYTNYYIVASSRFFDQILDILSDAVMNPAFDAEELERERRVVIEELNRREDTPSIRTFDTLYATAYTVHPYRRPIAGTRDIITRMSREVLLDYYRTYYVPGNVAIVVVGNVKADEAVAKVRRAFRGFRGTPPTRMPRQPEPPFTEIRRATVGQDVRVSYLAMGWIAPGVRDPDIYATDVLLFALGHGRASRLFREIQERQGLAQQISTSFVTGEDPALFQVFAVVDPQNVDRAEQAILEQIQAVRDHGISEEELRRAKNLLEGETIFDTHTTRGQAHNLGFYATIADVGFALTYVNRIRQVTRDDVQRVARRILDPQRYAVAVIRPRSR